MRRFFPRTLIILTVLITALPLYLLVTLLYQAARSRLLSPGDRWLEDVTYLEKVLTEEHVDLTYFTDPVSIRERSEILRARIRSAGPGDLNRSRLLTDVLGLVAAVRDPHTAVDNIPAVMGVYPFYIFWFDDGPHVIATTREHAHIMGARLLRIDDTPVETAYELFKQVVPHSNESGFRSALPLYLRTPLLLHGLDIASSPRTVTLRVRTVDGTVVAERYESMTGAAFESRPDYAVMPTGSGEEPPPLYRRRRGEHYWYAYMKETKLLYVRYRRAANMRRESGEAFFERVLSFADSVPVERFVLDLRGNSGGDNFFHLPLVAGLRMRPGLNARGRLFVVIDRGTFSAAIGCAGDMERYTNALFVGEPFGDRPNTAGDPRYYTLPHSGLQVGISKLIWLNTHPHEARDSITIDLRVPKTFAAFAAGWDPALERIINYGDMDYGDMRPATPDAGAARASDETVPGRYRFSADMALRVEQRGDRILLGLGPLVAATLHPEAGGGYRSDLFDMRLARPAAPADGVTIRFDGGAAITLERLQEGELTPLEMLSSGRLEAAREAFVRVHERNPGLLSLRRNNLNMLAWQIASFTGDHDRALALIGINSLLNPDDPFVSIRAAQMSRLSGRHVRSWWLYLEAGAKCVRRYFQIRNMNDHYLPL